MTPFKDAEDQRGQKIRRGDIVVYHSATRGQVIGMVKYDPEERKAIHLITKKFGMIYVQKHWRDLMQPDLLNLSRLPDDLDSLV